MIDWFSCTHDIFLLLNSKPRFSEITILFFCPQEKVIGGLVVYGTDCLELYSSTVGNKFVFKNSKILT